MLLQTKVVIDILRCLYLTESFFIVPRLGVGNAQIEQGGHVVRVHLQRLLIAFDGEVELFHFGINIGQVVERIDRLRIDLNGLLQIKFGFRSPGASVVSHADIGKVGTQGLLLVEVFQEIGGLRRHCKALSVKLSGNVTPSCVVSILIA